MMSTPSVQERQDSNGPCDRVAFLGRGPGLGLPPLLEFIVHCCATFGTMDEHLRAVQRALDIPQTKAGPLREVLRELLDRGLLVSERQLFGGVEPRPRAAVAIKTLAIPSRAGSRLLPRAVRSYSHHMGEFGRRQRILVSEDGPGEPDADGRRACAEACDPACELQFLGAEQRRALARDVLERSGAPAEVVEFALFGGGLHAPTYGANRNAILLATAGECVFTGDDDTLCVPLTLGPGGRPDVLALAGEREEAEMWCFADRQEALASARPAALDVFSAHEQLLGASTLSAAAEAFGQSRLGPNSPCGHLLDALLGDSGRVAITYNGSLGDSGLYSARSILMAENPNTRGRLFRDAETLERALSGREMGRVMPHRTISHGGPHVGMFMGIDNRELLPPFFPVYRNEDGVFACGMALLRPDAQFGHLPFVLQHAPPAGRSAIPFIPPRARVSEVLMCCLRTAPEPGAGLSSESRMRAVGEHFVGLARTPEPEFLALIGEACKSRARSLVSLLESLLRRFGRQPAWWAREVERNCERMRSYVNSDDEGMPEEIVRGWRAAERPGAMRRLLGSFGSLLLWWPELFGAARALRQAGAVWAVPSQRS